MPNGQLYIRQYNTTPASFVDAFTTYGLSFSDSSLSKLITPAPNKELVQNKSRLQHGKRVLRNSTYIKKDEREISLEMHITAPTKELFWNRYVNFCNDILAHGVFEIYHSDIKYTENNVTKNYIFRLVYLDCTQFSEFCMEMAKFALRVSEPDPTNRGETDAWAAEEQQELNPQSNT